MTRPPGYQQPPGWQRTRRRIMARDSHTCYVCGRTAQQVDHVIPVAEGGSHADDNLAAICETCHERKSQAEAARGTRRFHADATRRPKRTRPTEPHPGAIR